MFINDNGTEIKRPLDYFKLAIYILLPVSAVFFIENDFGIKPYCLLLADSRLVLHSLERPLSV